MTHVQWGNVPLAVVEKKLETDFSGGLSASEAKRRLSQYGKNVLEKKRRFRLLFLFLKQVKSPLVYILLAAGVGTFVLGEYTDAAVISIALAVNVGVGLLQEGRASRAFESLRAAQKTRARLIRGGKTRELDAEELVPGDVVLLAAGMRVPADVRLISATGLRVNEAVLSGEWVGVVKEAETVSKEKVSEIEQPSMVWMGTLVEEGFGRAVVVATGEQTQFGVIARALEEREDKTPLERSIIQLAQFLALAILVIVALIGVAGVFRGESLFDMLLVAVAVAVAVTPEGLPAALTVTLAVGMEAILKKKGLVRNLLAAETLGGTTIILTDKTGTLTEAKMDVARVITVASLLNTQENKEEGIEKARLHLGNDDERAILAMGVMASDAFIEWRDGASVVRGRPIERAIISAGLTHGLVKNVLLEQMPQVDFISFSSDRQFAASLHYEAGRKRRMFVIGAPEHLLGHSSFILRQGEQRYLDEEDRMRLQRFQHDEGGRGSRLVAVSFKDVEFSSFSKEITGDDRELLPEALVFGGFIVLRDPIRRGVKKAIQIAQRAGIEVKMLTGDYPTTAAWVAEEVGIKAKGEKVILGKEIEGLSDAELLSVLKRSSTFARIPPHLKQNIARVLKLDKEVIAMTGDGVNDAPALKSADIGVALGSGTEVAKEASDLILLNDGFDVIVVAIKEGRRILDNLRKIVAYLLSTGFSEVIVIGGALLFGAPLPLLPAQILWVNLIEEGFMSIAFAFEPAEKDVMARKARALQKKVLSPRLRQFIILIAVVTGMFLIMLYAALRAFEVPLGEARTIMFIALAVDSIFFSLSLKDLGIPLWRINIFSNKYLLFALGTSTIALFAALTWEPLRTLLSLEPLSFSFFGMVAIFGLVNLYIIEGAKYLVFGKEKTR
ncbi:MAG: HAD-IC family P-type ATPase [Parcubacteria group bacterium]|nr:HAD-IC family P-type ATPase [Parcubacteria group bacterium]